MERNEEKVLQKAHTPLPHTYPHRGKERGEVVMRLPSPPYYNIYTV
ncbi:hypothetical protein [Prevotella jejuni]